MISQLDWDIVVLTGNSVVDIAAIGTLILYSV